MIKEYVDAFMKNKNTLECKFREAHPSCYQEIVKAVITVINKELGEYNSPDPERIVEIDHGDYQGTLVYVIGHGGYQPYEYSYVRIFYGSCSGCDTLQAISGYSSLPPDEEQVKEYMTLALHIVQGLRTMSGDAV